MVRKTVPEKTAATESNEPEVTIIKEATCPTTSGKSTLGYQVGVDESGEIFFKLISNTGGGLFTSRFFPYSRVLARLESLPDGQPFSSYAIKSLIKKDRGSSNDASFVASLLRSEGILELTPGKTRLFRACHPSRFLENVEALRKSSGSTTTKKTAATSKAKTPASAKAKAKAASKKTSSKTR